MENREQPAANSRGLSPQIILGIFVVAIGVIFLLDNLNFIDAGRFIAWWPAILILVGGLKLSDSSRGKGKVGPIILMVIGTFLLLGKIAPFGVDVWELSPLLLVLAGGAIIWGAKRPRESVVASNEGDSVVNGVAVMSGVDRASGSADFRGGELTAVMGGCKVDLRNARLNRDAVINAVAFWGGVEIYVPRDWTVVCEGFPFLGGFEDATQHPTPAAPHKLIVKGMAVMGAVEVKN